MASFGKHLHAKQNSKLAKYAESANFAHLSKQTHNKYKNAKGLRPLKRSEPKNLRHKRKTSAKNAKGLPPFKRSEPKNFRHKRTTSEKNAKGLRPFKRSEPKNLWHKRTTSAKTPRGFDLKKGPKQKTFGTNAQQVQKLQWAFQRVRTKNLRKKGTISAKRRPTGYLGKIERWMPERGETFFPQEPSAPIIRFTQNRKN